MPGVTLDTGALIAIERADRMMQALLDEAHAAGLPGRHPGRSPSPSMAGRPSPSEAGSNRSASPNVTVPALDEPRAKAAGILCEQLGTSDAIDASVVLNPRQPRPYSHHQRSIRPLAARPHLRVMAL